MDDHDCVGSLFFSGGPFLPQAALLFLLPLPAHFRPPQRTQEFKNMWRDRNWGPRRWQGQQDNRYGGRFNGGGNQQYRGGPYNGGGYQGNNRGYLNNRQSADPFNQMMDQANNVRDFTEFIQDVAVGPMGHAAPNGQNAGAGGQLPQQSTTVDSMVSTITQQVTGQVSQRLTENFGRMPANSRPADGQLQTMLNNSFGHSHGNSPLQPRELTPEFLAEAVVAVNQISGMTERDPNTPAPRRRLPPRTSRSDSSSIGSGGLDGPGTSPPTGPHSASGRGAGSDPDPMVDPVTAAPIICHCRAPDKSSAPRTMMKKSMLVMAIQAAYDIRQLRDRAKIILNKNDTAVMAYGRKDDAMNAIMETCPF